MKNLIGFVIIVLSILFFSCSNNDNKEQAEQQRIKDSVRVADSLRADASMKKRKAVEEADAFKIKVQDKIKAGKAIMLSDNGEALPLKAEGSKVYAVKMPDGNLWQVKKEGNKMMLQMPNGENMEEKMVNGRMVLITDDNKQYEVQLVDGKMMAIMPDSSMVAMSKE